VTIPHFHVLRIASAPCFTLSYPNEHHDDMMIMIRIRRAGLADRWRGRAIGRTTHLRFTCRGFESWLVPMRSGFGQATYSCVPLSPSSINLVPAKGWSLWLEHNRGLVKSNGSLYNRVYDEVICGLTAKRPGSAPNSTIVIEYGTTFLLRLVVDTQRITPVICADDL